MLVHIHKKYTRQHMLKKQVVVILSCVYIYVSHLENSQKFKQLEVRTQQKFVITYL